MKRGNLVTLVRGACGGKVRRSAARSGKPLRLLLVDGSLVRGGGGGGEKGGKRRQNCRSTRLSQLRLPQGAAELATLWPKGPNRW